MQTIVEPTTMRPARECVISPVFSCGHSHSMRLTVIGIQPELLARIETELGEVPCFTCSKQQGHIDTTMPRTGTRQFAAYAEKMLGRVISYATDIDWYDRKLSSFDPSNITIDIDHVDHLRTERLQRLAEIIYIGEQIDCRTR